MLISTADLDLILMPIYFNLLDSNRLFVNFLNIMASQLLWIIFTPSEKTFFCNKNHMIATSSYRQNLVIFQIRYDLRRAWGGLPPLKSSLWNLCFKAEFPLIDSIKAFV